MLHEIVTQKLDDGVELRAGTQFHRVSVRVEVADFYNAVIAKLVGIYHCYDKSLNIFGDPVEK